MLAVFVLSLFSLLLGPNVAAPSGHPVTYNETANPVAEEINSLLLEHLESTRKDTETRWLRQAFIRDGYLKVSSRIPSAVKERISDEALRLLAAHAKRRDLRIPVTGNTPRFMSNVRQQDVAMFGEVIPAVYHSNALMDWLGSLVGDTVIPNPWEYEKFIINRQEHAGDTHGWHWGDYPFSMIWVIRAPDERYGGQLEYVPHTWWDKREPLVEEHLKRNNVRSASHQSGDVYLLKSDTTLHRVAPLVQDATRVIINMAWERASDKGRLVTHETFAFRD